MSTRQLLLALACVLAISIGQLLFKVVGNLIATGPALALRPVLATVAALAIYGVATLGWILLLRDVPLFRAYPYMALSFVAVPLLGLVVLAERPSPMYALGVVLIVAGVWIAARSS
jgi:drug/metabolite transporter (DMT)-like permease